MSDSEVIAGLGTRQDHVATSPAFDAGRVALTEDEQKVFAAVGRVRQIGELVSQCGLPEPRAIATLLALRAKGAVVPARVQAKAPSPAPTAAMAEEVDLDAARKREILDLDARIDADDFFALLGVPHGADAQAIKQAYFELSRRHHPDRFFGKNLGSFKGRVERIFKRLTEAQNTLSDPGKRAKYLASHPRVQAQVDAAERAAALAAEASKSSAQVAAQKVEQERRAEDVRRDAERRARVARHPYLAKHARVNELVVRARAAIAQGDYAAALTDLHTASQGDDRNHEIKALLADTKVKADQQRSTVETEKARKLEAAGDLVAALQSYRAASNLNPQNGEAGFATARLLLRANVNAKDIAVFAQRAVEASPKSAEAHAQLARVYDLAGMKQLSRRHYEEVLKLDPSNAEAKKAVKGRWPF